MIIDVQLTAIASGDSNNSIDVEDPGEANMWTITEPINIGG